MEWLSDIAQRYETPLLASFALGLLTAVSPCPLATNISATAYISRELTAKRQVIIMGFLYTLGRGISYSVIGVALYFGASKFQVARFFQGNGELILGPLLLIVGIIMTGIIRLPSFGSGALVEKLTEYFKNKGAVGALILGIIFALAFCPYSGALYFGILIPMSISEPSGLYLPFLFAIGTGLPVLFFSYLIASGASRLGRIFSSVTKLEKVMRVGAGVVFIVTGMYYILIFAGAF
jgi:cytochrome c-type biogenesis protein